MKNRIWLAFLGAVLLASTTASVNAAAKPLPAQTSSKSKSKMASSKSKKRRRTVAAKPKGQKTPTSDRIKEIQTALQKEGMFEGEPSGKWDEATTEALKKYQDKNGLNPTGKIDAISLEKLGLGSETAGKGAPVPGVSSSPSPAPKSTQQ